MDQANRTSSGFTLVELMVVVVITGILMVVAIPAFSRYIKKARTAEASGYLAKMWAGSVSYYETDHADDTGNVFLRQFPGAGGSAPQEPTCCGSPKDKCPGSPPEYADAIWVALSFNIPDPHLYRPSYSATATTFTGEVHGDLDCDGSLSTFRRTGKVNASTGDVEAAAAAYSYNETE